MSATNGHAAPRDARPEHPAAGLARQLLEYYFRRDEYYTASDLWDRVRGDYIRTLPTSTSDRRAGGNWPIWRSETDLDRIRQQARVVCTVNSYAKGFLANFLNHTVGKGCQYKVVSKEQTPDADLTKPAGPNADALKAYVARCQDIVDRFLKRNRWNVMADPRGPLSLSGTREREIVTRDLRDGEVFLRLYRTDGGLVVRFLEPEWVRSPAGVREEEGWSYGVKSKVETDPDGHPVPDVETAEAYSVFWPGATQAELLDAAEVLHAKGFDTDSTIKRGVSFFSWDVAASFERARVLQRNVSISAAVKAAIAETWKHLYGTQAEVSTFRAGQREGYTERTKADGGSETENFERRYPGMVRDIPDGMEPVYPGPDNTPAWLQGAQADLQQAVAGGCAPLYWAADTSMGTYAGLKEAGAPAVKMAEARQTYYTAIFARVAWEALRVAVENHEIEDRLHLIDLQVEAPTVYQRDRLQVAQESQILNQLGALSPQTICMEAGRDYEVEAANIQAHQERFGQAGLPLGLPGEDGQLPGGPPGVTPGLQDDAGGALHEGRDGRAAGPFLEAGGTCKPGERSDLTGCVPASGDAAPGTTATTVSKAVGSVEDEIRDSQVEIAVTLDAKSGEVLSRTDGSAGMVSGGRREMEHLKDNIHTHNHPEHAAFSPSDIRTMILGDAAEYRAVTSKGVFVATRPEGGWGKSGAKLRDMGFQVGQFMDREYAKAKQKHLKSGRPEAEAREVAQYDANVAAAKRYGFGFRFEPRVKESLEAAGTCKPGETAAKSGCVPDSGDAPVAGDRAAYDKAIDDYDAAVKAHQREKSEKTLQGVLQARDAVKTARDEYQAGGTKTDSAKPAVEPAAKAKADEKAGASLKPGKDAGPKAADATADAPSTPDAKAGKLAAMADTLKGAAAATVSKVADFAVKKYTDLESQFGRAGAIAILGASVVLTPIPVPGTSLVPIALAKGYMALRKRYSGGEAVEGDGVQPDAAAVRAFLAELYAAAGEEPPELSDEDIAAALGQTTESAKLDSCVKQVAAKGKADSAYAVCRASLGECDEGDCECPACKGKRAAPLLEDAATLDVPDERQDEGWSCGAAATTAVCKFFGVTPDTEGDAIRQLGSSPHDGTDPERIVTVLEDHGLSTTALAGMDLDQLEWCVSKGRPVVCCIQAWEADGDGELGAGHYVVVIGVTPDAIVVMDPARFAPDELGGYGTSLGGQRVAIPREEFLRRWVDVDSEGAEYRQYGVAVKGPA